jgi:hypothetical protein
VKATDSTLIATKPLKKATNLLVRATISLCKKLTLCETTQISVIQSCETKKHVHAIHILS